MGHSIDLPLLDVPRLLRQYGLRPDQRLGQVFLVDPVALQRVTESAEITRSDAVLEIGAGLGSLTRYLAVRAGSVIAVELDANLIKPLEHVLSPYHNVRVVQGDILELDQAQLMQSPDYLVVANIPYYITSALIRHLLNSSIRPKRIVLTVQREVAARICAVPGEMSLLALSVQVFGLPQIMTRIPAGAFYPSPKIDSAVVRIDLYPSPVIPRPLLETFFHLARAGFSQRRKTLRNSLTSGLALRSSEAEHLLKAAGLDPRRRAETLDLDEWGRLAVIYGGEFI
ncbi:MAG TPA: 16S rRNA (adenine(1518)-N(6)/adenine(1519)-N(6))-dimethyltransferase RsmA [Anaerolineales bacterium]|nr:16S rRNA (adenine(1518)-N(6)/adenine(1519)-N(6))-dimethyltransferase RsmA [Anaerolineales bacterium]